MSIFKRIPFKVRHELEQRYAMKFRFELGETVKIIKRAYRDDGMGRSSVFGRHELFREEREQVENDRRSPTPFDDQKLREFGEPFWTVARI